MQTTKLMAIDCETDDTGRCQTTMEGVHSLKFKINVHASTRARSTPIIYVTNHKPHTDLWQDFGSEDLDKTRGHHPLSKHSTIVEPFVIFYSSMSNFDIDINLPMLLI